MDAPPTSASTRLPGVGSRLDLHDADGRPLHAVRRRSGHVELHTADTAVELDPVAASTVGAFISGHFRLSPEAADRLGDALGGLVIDWVRVGPGDAAVGRTIEELAIRQRTGATVIAVLRGSQPLVAPDPSLRLERRDDLVFACRDADRSGFLRFLAEGR